MRLATINHEGQEQPVVLRGGEAFLLREIARYLTKSYPLSLLQLIRSGMLADFRKECAGLQGEWASMHGLPADEVEFTAPYRNPVHILGVGMNYVEKAEDLQATPVEDMPVCFMKPATSLVGINEGITLPAVSKHVTAEGELSLIIGRRCFEVGEEEALEYVAGYTTSLDLTAKDIHAQNPRFIQMAKLCKGFFSFGPEIVLLEHPADLGSLQVETVQNGKVIHRNTVRHMIYTPAFIVSYISQFLELQPGDVIMTGTPGSFTVAKGDVAACRVTGMRELQNAIS